MHHFFDPSRREAADSNGAAPQPCMSALKQPPIPLSTHATALLSQPATTTPPSLPLVPPAPAPRDAEPTIIAPISASSRSPAPVPPPTSTSDSLPPTPSSQPRHFYGREMFNNAQGIIISNSQFIDASHAGSGLERLLKFSMSDAFHDSGARYPPPKCHLGTRNEYIDLITNWALEKSNRKEPILWMHGPFGVGKSAVAQSCAEALESIDKLAATLFFSRSNGDRDDPRRIFTSIAYQIATKCPSLGEIISRRMTEHPALATKSLSKQSEDLLVQPLGQVDIPGSGLDGCAVIIDGLDECRGTAEQCEMIKIIAASVDKHTTPFRWFITSRPEDPIVRTMNSSTISPVCSRVELPVSRAIDHEILVYLTDEFKLIRKDHGFPESWPSEEVLALLVERGDGLWIYVGTMVRFIKDENSLGPEDQLRIVLEFAKDVSGKVGPDNPLAEMDFFYTLIMQRVPPKVRTTVQKILLVHSVFSDDPSYVATALRLSADQLRRACSSIQSVMELQGSDLDSMEIQFYHTSFLDFMKDPQRSKDLYSEHIVFPLGTVLPEGLSSADHYANVVAWFWGLCEVPEHPLDSQTATSLAELPFKKMLGLLGDHGELGIYDGQARDNLPAEFRDKIIREGRCPIPGCMNTGKVWILGHGENETVPRQWETLGFELENNQGLRNGKCICGAQIRRGRRPISARIARVAQFLLNTLP
ncbi:hypothetical protein D9756_004416 [Leucocoprinus leucothites]|uniref:Nephrocystin 3-like N-terminal domain-containing protein n=1 Tax=Leucocoprinus leucothites TaxID=201217 RepID=A0A8H5G016_9AGAR|nr:hypothetical protein D9756_004416 [Leucoagaricus leucothites]